MRNVDKDFVLWAHENGLYDATAALERNTSIGDKRAAGKIFSDHKNILINAFGDNEDYIKMAFAYWIARIKDDFEKMPRNPDAWHEYYQASLNFTRALEKINSNEITKITFQDNKGEKYEVTGAPMDEIKLDLLERDIKGEFTEYKANAQTLNSDSPL